MIAWSDYRDWKDAKGKEAEGGTLPRVQGSSVRACLRARRVFAQVSRYIYKQSDLSSVVMFICAFSGSARFAAARSLASARPHFSQARGKSDDRVDSQRNPRLGPRTSPFSPNAWEPTSAKLTCGQRRCDNAWVYRNDRGYSEQDAQILKSAVLNLLRFVSVKVTLKVSPAPFM